MASFLAVFVLWAVLVNADISAADDGRGILRWDPLENQLVPIAPGEMKAGRVYSHFDHRLDRRVWSFVKPGGEFWYAFGEGTVQEALRFDIPFSRRDLEDKVRDRFPNLLEMSRRQGRGVKLRLNSDNQWVIHGVAGIRSIYNAETRRRWERHGDKYVRVAHSFGDRWEVRDGRYLPAR